MGSQAPDLPDIRTQLEQARALAAERERELVHYMQQRQALETLLRATQSQYQTTFELAAIGIAHISPDGKFLRANPFLCQMLGYASDELLRRTFQELTHPEDLEKDIEFVGKMLAGELDSYTLEKRYVRKDSQIVWAHLTVSLVRDRFGCPDYFISFVKNIDQRKRALDEVERSRARLKAVLDTLAEGVFVFDHEGKLLEVNSAAMSLCGYEREQEISARLEDLQETFEVFDLRGKPVAPEDWPVACLLMGKSMTEAEVLVRRRGANRTWIGCFSGWMTTAQPNELPLLVLTVQDVTARRQAEVAARVGENRLRSAFDNVPDAMVIYDNELRIQAVNKALLDETGLKREELLGKRDSEINSHFFSIWRGGVRAAFDERASQHEDLTFTDVHGLRSFTVTCVPLIDEARKVSEVMVICHDYTDRERAEERARHAALHDPLTGLPNRALLFEYARHLFAGAQRDGESVAVAFIDLDRFKPINDTHGHSVGDSVLQEVASRLRAGTRGKDLVFRLGGDEFLVLLSGLERDRQPEAIARHMLDAVTAPYKIDGMDLSLSACIGISVYPRDAADIDILISQADAAMYEAKMEGKGQIRLYTRELAKKVQSKQQIENALKRALRQGELCLHYQPLVSTRTNEVVSLEALVRMTSAEFSPEHFVPIAESSGLIAELSDWVLEEVCGQIARWKSEGLPHIPVAVNVSALQFRNKTFIQRLVEAIRNGRLSPDDIQVELTETTVMEDIQNAVNMLHWLRDEGVKVSLDDFGTGYSSLNYLSRLPLDKIKVDKSFVHRLMHDDGSRAITCSIIALGQSLGLKTVAEGIESAEEFAYLQDRGCDEVQGYYVCKPVAGNMFGSWYRGYSGQGSRKVDGTVN